MKISLVIPAFNEEKYLGACLEHVVKNGSKLFEVIVVDNASTDATASIAKSFPNVRVVSEPSKGLTKARQKGLEEAQGDVIAYIDADTWMLEGWVDTITDTFSKNEHVVAVSGPYVYHDVPWYTQIAVKIFWLCLAYPSYLSTGYMLIGGNFAARKSALLSIGGFDVTISFYGEDADIARRLHTVGKILFLMNLPVETSARRFKGEGLFSTFKRYVLNFLSIAWNHKPLTDEYRDIR